MSDSEQTIDTVDPFWPADDYPPERIAHDAAVAVQEAMDRFPLTVMENNVLYRAIDILKEKADG